MHSPLTPHRIGNMKTLSILFSPSRRPNCVPSAQYREALGPTALQIEKVVVHIAFCWCKANRYWSQNMHGRVPMRLVNQEINNDRKIGFVQIVSTKSKTLSFKVKRSKVKVVHVHSRSVVYVYWVHNPNGISIGSVVFAQLTAEIPVLYNGSPLAASHLPFRRRI